MKTVTLTDKTPLADVLRQGEEEEIVLVRDGRTVALIVPFDDDDAEWYARERDPAFLESIADARRQVDEGKTIRHDALKRDLGITDSDRG